MSVGGMGMKKYPIESCEDCLDCIFFNYSVECDRTREQLKFTDYGSSEKLLEALFNQCPLEDY